MYTTEYTVRAIADPQSIARVLDGFSQRSLVPEHVEASRCGEWIKIRITVEGLEEALGDVIAHKLNALFLVDEVSCRRTNAAAGVSMAA